MGIFQPTELHIRRVVELYSTRDASARVQAVAKCVAASQAWNEAIESLSDDDDITTPLDDIVPAHVRSFLLTIVSETPGLRALEDEQLSGTLIPLMNHGLFGPDEHMEAIKELYNARVDGAPARLNAVAECAAKSMEWTNASDTLITH